jgi:membrane-bound lytic murein transglycosylase B
MQDSANRITSKQYTVFWGFLLVIGAVFLAIQMAAAATSAGYFQSLQKRLIKDGFDPNVVAELYRRPEISFEAKGVSRFLVHREGKLNYDQFTRWKSIRNAKKYIKKHSVTLEKTEKTYGVEKEVITAIILVETRLGKLLGGPSTLNILSTTASLADPDIREMFWGNISKSTQLTHGQYKKWVERKSKWAYNELNAFLIYTAREHIDPVTVSGSYSGAMGISQFMPSNILTFARDGDGDGRIDLFNHEDAIASIASYLKHYGWHPGINRKKAYRVIYHYNHSNPYVDTILKVSERLKP